MAKRKNNNILDEDYIDGYNPRHLSALIRRKMIEKTVPSKKGKGGKYKRDKYKDNGE